MYIWTNTIFNQRLDEVLTLLNQFRHEIIASRNEMLNKIATLEMEEGTKKEMIEQVEKLHKTNKESASLYYNLFRNRYAFIDMGILEISKLSKSTESAEEKIIHQKLIDSYLDIEKGTVANMDKSIIGILRQVIKEKQDLRRSALALLGKEDTNNWKDMYR